MAETIKNKLLLRQGTYNSFKDLAAANENTLGTMYFTVDEGGMYIDAMVNEQPERVRIQGSVLYFEDFKNFSETVRPPYSEDVIYFIAQSTKDDNSVEPWNAFFRWDKTENKFIQLNVTAAAFQTAIKDLSDRVLVLEQAADDYVLNTDFEKFVEDNTKNLEELDKRIDAYDALKLDEKLKNIDQTFSDIDDRFNPIEESIEDLSGRVTAIDKEGGELDLIKDRLDDLEDPTTGLPNLIERVTELDKEGGRVAVLEGDVDDLKDRMNTAEGTLDGLKTFVIGNSTTALTNPDSVLPGDGVTTVIDVLNNLHDDLHDESDGALPRLELVEGILDTLVGDGTTGSISGITEDIKDLKDRVKTIEDDYITSDDLSSTLADYATTDALSQAIDGLKTNEIADLDSRLDAYDALTIGDRLTSLERDDYVYDADLTETLKDYATNQNVADAIKDLKDNEIADLDSRLDAYDALTIDDRLKTLERDDYVYDADLTETLKDYATNQNVSDAIQNLKDNEIADLDSRLDAYDALTIDDRLKTLERDDYVYTEDFDELEEELKKEISAANAMRFIDFPVNSSAKLAELYAKTDLQIGDTVIVTENFEHTFYDADGVPTKVQYHAGDLLVAKSTGVDAEGNPLEVNGVIPVANIDFIQVDTGYDGIHNNSLSITENASGDVQLEYRDIVGALINSIAIKSTCDNLVLDVDDTGALNLGLVWDTF